MLQHSCCLFLTIVSENTATHIFPLQHSYFPSSIFEKLLQHIRCNTHLSQIPHMMWTTHGPHPLIIPDLMEQDLNTSSVAMLHSCTVDCCNNLVYISIIIPLFNVRCQAICCNISNKNMKAIIIKVVICCEWGCN